jgi:hypothetical protein
MSVLMTGNNTTWLLEFKLINYGNYSRTNIHIICYSADIGFFGYDTEWPQQVNASIFRKSSQKFPPKR